MLLVLIKSAELSGLEKRSLRWGLPLPSPEEDLQRCRFKAWVIDRWRADALKAEIFRERLCELMCESDRAKLSVIATAHEPALRSDERRGERREFAVVPTRRPALLLATDAGAGRVEDYMIKALTTPLKALEPVENISWVKLMRLFGCLDTL